MRGIGVIALAGIVVNNNIVLIDTYNELRKRGFAPYDAVLRTSAQRLRPVLLTTVTTVLGLMPMALEVNVDLFAREINFGGRPPTGGRSSPRRSRAVWRSRPCLLSF
jgi:multidrug efflux pump